MRRYDVPLRFDVNPSRWEERGQPTFDSTTIRVEQAATVLDGGIPFTWRLMLRIDPETGLYVEDWQVISFPAIRMDALAGILLGSCHEEVAEAEAEIEYRLLTTSDVRTWNGTAWAVASGDTWNTKAEIEAGLPSWHFRSLGLAVRLRSLHGDVTPVFYGLDAIARMEFAPGSTVGDVGGSWAEDALVRAFGESLKTGVEVYRTDEFEAPDQGDGECSSIDYSDGVGRANLDVVDVAAVYDLDADPDRQSPLVGSFDAKVLTLAEPVLAGARLSSRLRIKPVVAMVSDSDYYSAGLPALLIEGVTEESFGLTSPFRVLDKVRGVVTEVPPPTESSFDFEVNILDTDRFAAIETAEALLAYASGSVRVHSNATGRSYVAIPMSGIQTVGERGALTEVTTRFRIQGVLKYNRAAEEKPVLLTVQLDTELVSTGT